jgi:hypothetical protein
MKKPVKKKMTSAIALVDCTCSDLLVSHFVKHHIASVTKSGGKLHALLYTDCQLSQKKCPEGTALITIRPCPRPPCPK